jgi:serine/threonine protein kinase
MSNITPQEADLLEHLLCVNPANRITAADALKHPLFNGLANNYIESGLTMSRIAPATHVSVKDSGLNTFAINFLRHLHSSEMTVFPTLGFPENQTFITEYARAMLIDWLILVVDAFNISARTFHLATAYIDKYISLNTSVVLNQFQLVGSAALYLASKCEDIACIGVENLVTSSGDS